MKKSASRQRARASCSRWLALLLFAGCSTGPRSPAVEAVTPAAGLATATTDIDLTGESPAVVRVSYRDRERSRILTGYTISIGGTPAVDVAYAGFTMLQATVPAGLAVGVYDVVVTACNAPCP